MPKWHITRKLIKGIRQLNSMERKTYRTLRGFVEGEEPDEENYFAYSATLRIFGTIDNLDEITDHLGFEPTLIHRKGEKRGPQSPPLPHDMWSYQPPLDEEEALEKHIDVLWTKLKPHTAYLLQLKDALTVDVFLGYRTNCDMAGIEVPHTALEMFTALQIPFGLSIIVT
jgi:hypothetical protein